MQNIIITGASKGLGEFMTRKLARHNEVDSLTIVARSVEKLEVIQRELSREGLRIEIVGGDLATHEGVAGIVQALQKTGIAFNVLINNAGYGYLGKLETTPPAELEKIFFTNLIAPMELIQYFLPIARPGKWGRIINISSISVFHPSPDIIPYVVSKSGLLSLSECVAGAEAANGITCNTILPGMMLSDMGKLAIRHSFPDYTPENAARIEKKLADRFPSKQFTTFQQITDVVEFLLSPQGDALNGEFFRVASGLL